MATPTLTQRRHTDIQHEFPHVRCSSWSYHDALGAYLARYGDRLCDMHLCCRVLCAVAKNKYNLKALLYCFFSQWQLS